MCRTSEEDPDDVPGRRVSSRTTARLRRTSVPVYGRRKNNSSNNAGSSDGSGSVLSLHRDALHRRNMLTWRGHWQPSSADADNNNNNNNGITPVICRLVSLFIILVISKGKFSARPTSSRVGLAVQKSV